MSAPPSHSTPLCVVLKVTADGSLSTAEGVLLGKVPPEFSAAEGLAPGVLLRFGAQGATEGTAGTPQLVGSPVSYLGRVTGRRTHADSWSRILFQARARGVDPHGGGLVTIESLLDSVSRAML